MVQAIFQRWGLDIPDWEDEHYAMLLDHPYQTGDQIIAPEGAYQILHRFFQQPYFKRIWVLQESTIRAERTRIHLGDYQMPWSGVIVADRFQRLWRKRMPAGQENSLPAWWSEALQLRLKHEAEVHNSDDGGRTACDFQSFSSLYLLILNTWDSFEATDARDKIFALLGLSFEATGSRKFALGFAPDYNKPPSEISHFTPAGA